MRELASGINLYWLPLGAGGHFVRFNGHVYEAIVSRRERRRPLDLYHSALEISVAEGRFVIENSWPIPDPNGAVRGVTVEGPVGSPRLARFSIFRYEIRRWRDGVIPDVDEAVASSQRLSSDHRLAHRLLELVLLGSVLGTVGAYVSLSAGDLSGVGKIPVPHLIAIVVGVPMAAVVCGWLLAGREPPFVARRALE